MSCSGFAFYVGHVSSRLYCSEPVIRFDSFAEARAAALARNRPLVVEFYDAKGRRNRSATRYRTIPVA